jgi:hypothetical protein
MQSQIEIETNLFGGIKSYNYECNFSFSEAKCKLGLFEIFSSYTNNLIQDVKILKNKKGLDLSFIETNGSLTKQLSPVDNELFSYQLSYKESDTRKKLADFHIITPFAAYLGSDIQHSIEFLSDPEISLTVDTPLLNDELSLESFRFGMDLYGMSSFANWFFKTPVVLESLLIEFSEGSGRILLKTEKKAKKSKLIDNISEPLARLDNILNLHILQDVIQKLGH